MVKIGLVQINNSFSGQNYLPYSVACLQAYAEKNTTQPGSFEFLPPIYKRTRIQDAVDHLKEADVVGFSTYVWNERISLEVARRLKALRPDILILFGGPQVPDESEEFMRQHDFIDLAVHNEGERTFLKILENLPSRDWRGIGLEGVSYIDADGGYHKVPNGARIRDLQELPSPFLNGMFDQLMAANPQEQWIGLWETNRGCPFQCTYCDWGSATAAKVTKFEVDRLLQEADWFSDRKIGYVFVCDANFGMLPRDLDLVQRVAANRQRTGFPQGFSVQNTKNATDRAYVTQKVLADAGLNKGVALSMQTLNPEALKNIKRDNISLDTYFELQRRFTQDRVETYSDLILALPGETYESFVDGIETLLEGGQHNRIQFNNLSILPNAEMAKKDYMAKFGMITVESEIINFHGTRIELDDDVAEMQQLVVGTNSMPPEDWRRTRAMCWMVAFLHFDKLFQIPIIVAHELTGLRYRAIFDAFMAVKAEEYPIIADVRDFFLSEARSIQNGGSEYIYAPDWLGIFWPADEFMFIRLTAEKRLGAFYEEAQKLIVQLAQEAGLNDATGLVEAAQLNRLLVKEPFLTGTVSMTTQYDILGFYEAVRRGEAVALQKVESKVVVDRDKAHYDDFNRWCQEVVWWGNKKGAYLFNAERPEVQLAGHF